MSPIPSEYFASRHRTLVAADAVWDWYILPSNNDQYQAARKVRKRISTAKELINWADHEGIAVVNMPAGPMLNTAARLAVHLDEESPQKEVAGLFSLAKTEDKLHLADEVVLTDLSKKYLSVVERLGIGAHYDSRYGEMAQCVYIGHPSAPREIRAIWEPGVTNRTDYDLPTHLVERFDTLVLTATHPLVTSSVLERFEGDFVAYNPGPVLKNASFGNTGFVDTIKYAHLLSLNREEATIVMKNMGYLPKKTRARDLSFSRATDIRQLFEDFSDSNLEWIIITMGSSGSTIFPRNPDKPGKKFQLSRDQFKVGNENIVDTVGAGDAHLTEAIRQLWRARPGRLNLKEVLFHAARASQEALLHPGGLPKSFLDPKKQAKAYPAVSDLTKIVNGK